jgi:hypothetical protein
MSDERFTDVAVVGSWMMGPGIARLLPRASAPSSLHGPPPEQHGAGSASTSYS